MTASKLDANDQEILRLHMESRDYWTPEFFALVQLSDLLWARREREWRPPDGPKGPVRCAVRFDTWDLYLEIGYQGDAPEQSEDERAALGIWRRNVPLSRQTPEWERLDTSSAVLVWREPHKLAFFLGKWFREQVEASCAVES